MKIAGVIQSLAFMMNQNSSVFMAASTDPGSATSTFSILSIANGLISFLGEVLYAVTKWILYFVDILFFYMQQMAGLNMDTSSLNRAVSKDSDMVFNFLLSNSTMISKIVRALIAMAIILIIVFTIFAIIKKQFDSMKTGKAEDPKTVLLSSFKSILLLFITPIIAIVGIVASNVLLKAFYNATDVYRSASLGTQIFTAASNSANRYRQYAASGQRIPITFDFTKQEEILEYYKENGTSSKMEEYLKSAENTIYSTYLMFNDEDFDSFAELEANGQAGLEGYYKVYDKSLLTFEDALTPYRRVRTFNEEYYVMADVIDFAISSSSILHIKTIEETLNSISYLPAPHNNQIMYDLISTFGISFYSEDDLIEPVIEPTTTNPYNTYNSDDWDVIRWSNINFTADENGEPIGRKQIQYNHVRGTTDEVNGAVYIVTGQKTIVVNNGTDDIPYTYYYPISIGYSDYSSKEFDSDYIERNQIIPAKGCFSSDGYPTAIRRAQAGTELIFYRDTLEEIVLGEAGNVLNTDFKQEEAGVLGAIVSFIKKLLNPASLLPNINFDSEEIVTTYTKVSIKCGSLDSGELHIGYLFSDALTSAISGDMYGLKLYTLFNPLNLNYLILVMGAYLLLKICFLSVFALVKRAYDLLLIIMIYPAAISTSPIDDGAAYKHWMQSYMSRLFMTYGLLLGINFVLMLFPVIESIEFFKPEDIVLNKPVARFSKIFSFIGVSINTQAKMMNFITAIMFQLVAFTYLDTDKAGNPGVYDTIMQIVNPNAREGLYSDNPGGMMLKTISDAGHMVGWAVSTVLFSGGALYSTLTKKGRKELADKIKRKAAPGSAILRDAQEKGQIKQLKEQKDAAYLDLMQTLQNKNSSQDEIEKKMKALRQAQDALTHPGSKEKKIPPGAIMARQKREQTRGKGIDLANKKANRRK